MAKYKTALGKTIDMSALSNRNERVRAVGNVPVNARGDVIDAQGRVVVPVTEKVNKNYAKTVGNRSANVIKKPTTDESPKKIAPPNLPKPEEIMELTQLEKDLESNMEDDLEVEKIKQEETKAQQKRGKK